MGEGTGTGGPGAALAGLRRALALAADGVVRAWEQDKDGQDPELGAGGTCDLVADALAGALAAGLPEALDARLEDGGHEGDDHAWLLVHAGGEVWGVDVPADVYETGGGMRWHKRPGARVGPGDVAIWRIDAGDGQGGAG